MMGEGVDQGYMEKALLLAKKAASNGDVPVGVVIVQDGAIIAEAFNEKELTGDVTAHAEVVAIRRAVALVGDWRLTNCTMYTTLEPCPMCAGAILHARLARVVYGAPDLKWGALSTKVNLMEEGLFNHRVAISFLEDSRCVTVLQDFFKQRR